MATVYLETTIPSYLAAEPSRDLIVAANQQMTHEWWGTAKDRFELYVSDAVMQEICRGDPAMAARRREIVTALPVLRFTEHVRQRVHFYEQELGLQGRAKADLLHIAFGVAYDMDYLVTWNCAHIANGEIVARLLDVNRRQGWWTPLILTPQELLGTSQPGDMP